MHYLSNILSTITLTTSVALLALAALTNFMRKTAEARVLAALCLAVLLYTAGYTMELNSASLDTIMIANVIEYVGTPVIPALWLILTFIYTQQKKLLRPWVIALVFLAPLATYIFRFTNDLHHLYYTQITLQNDPFAIVRLGKGPLYYVSLACAVIALILSSSLYLRQMLRPKGKKWQQALLFTATLLPLGAIVLLILDIMPYGIDPCPFAIMLSLVLFVVAIFRHGLMNIVPVAYRRAFEAADDCIIILDEDSHIIDFNPAAEKYIDCINKDSIGKSFFEVAKNVHLTPSGSVKDGVSTIEEHGGKEKYFSIKTNPIYDKRNKVVGNVVFLEDVTMEMMTLDKLNYYAFTDGLTGTHNRRYFLEQSMQEVNRSKRYERPLAMIILDLDDFKDVNDIFGHQMGDAVLITVAETLKKNLRNADILARFGGEEFIVLLPETDLTGGLYVAERIRKGIEAAEISSKKHTIRVTASFGVTAVNKKDGYDIDTLVQYADKALYAAKSQAGKNSVRSAVLPE
ncbi:MAG: diguanylate cyclase [Bacillota bacterium]|nr:diguanylate cyclase [Bacillota bacterium]